MKIVDSIQYRGINQVYVIGGDGSQRGAGVIFEEVRKRGLKVAVAGIPKTIDNDIPGIWHLGVAPPLELVANRLWLRVKDDNLVLQGLWCINLVLCSTWLCSCNPGTR